MDIHHEPTRPLRWLLVAGTGEYALAPHTNWMARALGSVIAKSGHGLVVGGWPGVDHVAADAFAQELSKQRIPCSRRLIQVVRANQQPDFRGGHIVSVHVGPQEWVEALKLAHAAILIGGKGGTYETYLYGLQERKPLFPIAGTGGDAQLVFSQMRERWGINPIAGVSMSLFERLQAAVNTESDARELAEHAVALAQRALDAAEKAPPLVFLSYAREDKAWAEELARELRRAELAGHIQLWYDAQLKPGERFREVISTAIVQADAAVFLVSKNLLASEFVRDHELGPVLRYNPDALQWLQLEVVPDTHELSPKQNLNGQAGPLSELTPSAQRDVVFSSAQAVVRAAQQRARTVRE